MQLYGAAAAEPWFAEFPGLLAVLTQRWRLEFERGWFGGRFSQVVAVRTHGQAAYLKVRVPVDDFHHERLALAAFGPTGASARLLESDERGALLIERLRPGGTLPDSDPGASARIAAGLATRLHKAELPRGIPPYSDLYSGAIERSQTMRHREEFPWEWWDAAMPAPAVLQPDDRTVLLHEDLHHGNILEAGGGWRTIDPHGRIGHPVHDAGQYLFNPHKSMGAEADAIMHRPDRVAVTRERMRIFADAFGVEVGVVRAAALGRIAMNAFWAFEDGEDPAPSLRIHEMIEAAD